MACLMLCMMLYLHQNQRKRNNKIPVCLSVPLRTIDFPAFLAGLLPQNRLISLVLPLWGKTREIFYSPPTTLSRSLADERFASLVE